MTWHGVKPIKFFQSQKRRKNISLETGCMGTGRRKKEEKNEALQAVGMWVSPSYSRELAEDVSPRL